ncbi:MAG: FHA domain-containing protein [Pseudomonadota bacterium]
MRKCSNPEHPHCTFWVMPGEHACAGGHPQGPAGGSSFELLKALRSGRGAEVPIAAAPVRKAHLHISGFDPRAAGGRQAIKLELRGLPAASAPLLTVQLQSALIAHGAVRHTLVRSLNGEWRPLFIEFSSRGKEHGQYQLDVELHSEQQGGVRRKWVCTLLLLVPRADATLAEIHQVFLSTHKNVRVMADDASIARVSAQTGGGRLDIDVTARNAGIAHLNLDATPGKVDLGFSTIAWDEDLIELDVPSLPELHPHPSHAACLVNAAPEAGGQRQVRLFALRECVLGRFEQVAPEADVLLTHFGQDGQDRNGLTRRLSGRHALIRRGSMGFEIEDVSRYGLLLDGVWPGKQVPVALRLGMRIELTASIKGIVVLGVTALLPNGVILHRLDQGEHAECFYFLEPERHPGYPLAAFPALPRAAAMPMLFHLHGGFWQLDPASGRESALCPGQLPRHSRFAAAPYPEAAIERHSACLTA